MPPINATFQGYAISGKGVSFTRTPGLSPNANAINLAVSGEVVLSSGDMVLSDGTNTLTLENQYAEEFYEELSESGRSWRGILFDRRWKYRFGQITAEHNRPGKEGTPTSETSLHALATELLDAMQEVDYDISALPTDVYPHVCWQAATPADELNRLLQEWGFVAVLQNAGTIKIWAKGSGADLPEENRTRTVTGQKRTRKPDVISIRGGRSIIERTFDLVPYGLDTDRAYKPLGELSYAPTPGVTDGGFGPDARNGFASGSYSDDERKLAQETVFRVYGLADADRAYLPWLSRIVQTVLENGEVRPGEPIVTGQEASREWDGQKLRTTLATPGYTLDLERGLVRFQCLICAADDDYAPTEFSSIPISITVAYHSVAADGTWSDADFYSYTSGSGANEMPYRNDKLVLRGIWDGVGGAPVWQNQAALDAYAASWVSQITEADEYVLSEEVEYAGIVDIECDGRIKSVTWSVSETGATTVVSLNTERAIGRAPTYHERTQTATNRSMLDASAAAVSSEQYSASVEGARAVAASPSRGALPASATDRGERRYLHNGTGEVIPAHSAVVLNGVWLEKMGASSRRQWGITDGEIPIGGWGYVLTSGQHYVRYPSGPVPQAGDRMSPANGSFTVEIDGSGAGLFIEQHNQEVLVALGTDLRPPEITTGTELAGSGGTPDATEWPDPSNPNDPVRVDFVSRLYDAGASIRVFSRRVSADRSGRLASISGESFINIAKA